MALPTGFRFNPTDEELVAHYLRRKVGGRPIEFNIIEIDLYKQEPWDLAKKSVSYGSDMEWYFFSPLDKKYANGARINRMTEGGYWKSTGKEKNVQKAGRKIGMKKILVFYRGRSPDGERTDWVMHEYRLNEEWEKVHAAQCHHFVSLPNVAKSMNIRHVHHVDASSEEDPPHLHGLELFVLCRVFKKSRVGPRSGDDRCRPTYVDDDIDRERFGPSAEAVKKVLEPGTASTPAIPLAPEQAPRVAPIAIPTPPLSVEDYAPFEEAGDNILDEPSFSENDDQKEIWDSLPPIVHVDDSTYTSSVQLDEAGESTPVPFGEYILDEPSFSENDDEAQIFHWLPSIECLPKFSWGPIPTFTNGPTFTDGPVPDSADRDGPVPHSADRDACTCMEFLWRLLQHVSSCFR